MCIVNHSRRFIFVHVPKSGGTSVSLMLSPLTTYRDQEIGATLFGLAINKPYAKRFGLRKHCSSTELKNIVGGSIWREYFTFAFVRNPYSRAFSIYAFLKRWREWEGSEVMDTFPTFAAFVFSDFFERPGPDTILEPQVHWIGGGVEGSALDVDSIYRVESMAESMRDLWSRVCPELPFDGESRIPISNASSSPDEWKEHLSNATLRRRIEARYEADFEAFEYATR